jgi:hypothetical protein
MIRNIQPTKNRSARIGMTKHSCLPQVSKFGKREGCPTKARRPVPPRGKRRACPTAERMGGCKRMVPCAANSRYYPSDCTRHLLRNPSRLKGLLRLRTTRVQGALSPFYFSPSLSACSGLFVAVISAKNGASMNNTATAGSFRFSLPIFFGCAGRTGRVQRSEVRSQRSENGSRCCSLSVRR